MIYICVYICVCVYVCVCICVCMCACMHACMYVCMYVYVYVCVLKKVHLVSCNTMMVQSALQDNNEYLCRDFHDFLKYEQHCSALIIDTLIKEMKYETKQYEGLVILDSLPQSEESKYDVHD